VLGWRLQQWIDRAFAARLVAVDYGSWGVRSMR
jgi:hypothetical protein